MSTPQVTADPWRSPAGVNARLDGTSAQGCCVCTRAGATPLVGDEHKAVVHFGSACRTLFERCLRRESPTCNGVQLLEDQMWGRKVAGLAAAVGSSALIISGCSSDVEMSDSDRALELVTEGCDLLPQQTDDLDNYNFYEFRDRLEAAAPVMSEAANLDESWRPLSEAMNMSWIFVDTMLNGESMEGDWERYAPAVKRVDVECSAAYKMAGM